MAKKSTGLGKGLDSLIPDFYDEDFDSNSAVSLEDILGEDEKQEESNEDVVENVDEDNYSNEEIVEETSENDESSEKIVEKISENEEKITNPGYKKVWRLYDKKGDNPIADVVTLAYEIIDNSKPYTIFDEIHVWKKKKVTRFYAKNLQVPVFINGQCVYESPSLNEIRNYCKDQVDNLWGEIKRFTNPHSTMLTCQQTYGNASKI